MDEQDIDVLTLAYMMVFLFVFGGIPATVPRRRNLLDAALTALVFMLALNYLRSLLGIYIPSIFDTSWARYAVRSIAMVSVTSCVVALWMELTKGKG